MTGGSIKGWCPSAYRPMSSGDGLLVRLRPSASRLSVDQMLSLAGLSLQFGNGMIDLTSRANLQLRGVDEAGFPDLLQSLKADGLVASDPLVEARRGAVVAPDWVVGDLTDQLACKTAARLLDLPELPDKMGFAVDAGAQPVLQNVSADVRFEQGQDGALLMVADGALTGCRVDVETAADRLIALLNWFIETSGAERKRMARHLDHVALPKEWQGHPRQAPGQPIEPGPNTLGPVFGVPFGATTAEQLADLIAATGPHHLRVTPWRSLILEGGTSVEVPGFVQSPKSAKMAVSACPGHPACGSASVETRDMARRLAGRTPGALHVSGCSKGCAFPKPSAVTLVGRNGRFDLVQNGVASDTPSRRGLAETELLELFP